MRPNNVVMISAATNTGTVNSSPLDAQFMMTGSVQAAFTDGAAAGTLILQFSNDPDTSLAHDSSGNPVPVNWTAIPSATVAVTAGGVVGFTVPVLNYRWVRASYTRSAGAGTFSVNGFFQGAS